MIHEHVLGLHLDVLRTPHKEESKRHPNQMPEPPQPLLSHPCCPRDSSWCGGEAALLWASHPVRKREPGHPAQETHVSWLYPWVCSFGCYPEFMMTDEGRNVDWLLDKKLSSALSLHHNRLVQCSHHCRQGTNVYTGIKLAGNNSTPASVQCNSRVEEWPTTLVVTGSRARSVRWGEPDCISQPRPLGVVDGSVALKNGWPSHWPSQEKTSIPFTLYSVHKNHLLITFFN